MNATKIFFSTGLFIAFAFLVALFTADLLISESSNSVKTGDGAVNVQGSLSQQIVLNMQEISKHNNSGNCWVLVNNKVYDLTSFIYSHSGGSSVILDNCGKDGSEAFNTQYGKGKHEPENTDILIRFYIGEFNQQINSMMLNKNLNNINSNNKFEKEKGEYEDEREEQEDD